MLLSWAKLIVVLFISNLVGSRFVDIGSPVLDCVRFRSEELRTLVFGTGFFHSDDNQRYVGTWDNAGTPYNSAFKIERIAKFKEPLYHIKMINTQEYLTGGPFRTATTGRLPILTIHKHLNYTQDESVFGFVKAKDGRGAPNGAWHIKNAQYDYYLIGTRKLADPPGGAAGFHVLQMDRTYQPELTKAHQFWVEQC